MEIVVGNSSRYAPIWEFRDLGSSLGTNGVVPWVGAAEQAIMHFHQRYANTPPTRRSLSKSSERLKRDDNCPLVTKSSTSATPASSMPISSTLTFATYSATAQCSHAGTPDTLNLDSNQCEDSLEDDPYQQGKCKDGQVLDPAEGG